MLELPPMIEPKVGRRAVDPRAAAAWKRYRPKAIGQLAAHLGITQPAVSKWRQVPADRLDMVAVWLQVPAHRLRPDLDPWSSL